MTAIEDQPSARIDVYPYRWVVLSAYALITVVIEIQWLTFAPIAREAKSIYQVSALGIDLLSLIFMLVYVVVCIPASYVIDTYGIRWGVGAGAVLTGAFGMMKGLFPCDYALVVTAQVGLAVAQPFILNAATKVAGQWFPLTERALAVGLATLSQFVGIIIAMVATPLMLTQTPDGDYDLSNMLMTYGLISLVGTVLLLCLLREKPPTPPHGEQEPPLGVFQGLGHILRQRDMRFVLPIFLLGLGMFNAISTCIDQICQLKGLAMDQSGHVGGVMLLAGLVGAVVLPLLSDKLRKRKAFVVIAMTFCAPGIVGLAVADSYLFLLAASFVLGFFLLGGGPVGFQYSAEVTWPAPESTSQGLLLLLGQISGIVFIVGMNMIGMAAAMRIFIGFAAVNIILSLFLHESKMIREP